MTGGRLNRPPNLFNNAPRHRDSHRTHRSRPSPQPHRDAANPRHLNHQSHPTQRTPAPHLLLLEHLQQRSHVTAPQPALRVFRRHEAVRALQRVRPMAHVANHLRHRDITLTVNRATHITAHRLRWTHACLLYACLLYACLLYACLLYACLLRAGRRQHTAICCHLSGC